MATELNGHKRQGCKIAEGSSGANRQDVRIRWRIAVAVPPCTCYHLLVAVGTTWRVNIQEQGNHLEASNTAEDCSHLKALKAMQTGSMQNIRSNKIRAGDVISKAKGRGQEGEGQCSPKNLDKTKW